MNLTRTRRVTLTVQTVDADDRAVSRPGFQFEVSLQQIVDGTQRLIQDDVRITTDEDGRGTFRVEGVENDRGVPDQTRADEITFSQRRWGPGLCLMLW